MNTHRIVIDDFKTWTGIFIVSEPAKKTDKSLKFLGRVIEERTEKGNRFRVEARIFVGNKFTDQWEETFTIYKTIKFQSMKESDLQNKLTIAAYASRMADMAILEMIHDLMTSSKEIDKILKRSIEFVQIAEEE